MTGNAQWRAGSRGFRDTGRARNTRLVMAGAFVGALLVLALATLFSWQLGENIQSAAERAFAAPKGACLALTTGNAKDIQRVPCGRKHEFELIGAVRLNDRGEDAPRPGAAEWDQITKQSCTPKAEQYLGGKLDPFGRFSVGALTPSEQQWQGGERSLRCALQHVGSSGMPLPMVGAARDADQSDVHEPGTCLGITSDYSVGDPVSCDKRHAYEIIGNVDLGARFTDGYPSEAKQSDKLPDLCNAVLTKYHGSPKLTKGLVLTWDTRKQASWDAGSKRVDCKVAGKLSKGADRLQSITGSIAGAPNGQAGGAAQPSQKSKPGKPAHSSGSAPSDSSSSNGG